MLGEFREVGSGAGFFGSFDSTIFDFNDLMAGVVGLLDGSLDSILSMVSRSDVDAKDRIGNTALAYAAARGDADTVRKLLLKGADPNTGNNEGMTPLRHAINFNRPVCVELLLESGADVKRKDFYGITSFYRAVLNLCEISILNKMYAYGADVDIRGDENKTPLISVVTLLCTDESKARRLAVMEWLLKRGAYLNAADIRGSTAISHAMVHRQYQAIEILFRYGANSTVQTADIHKLTTFHVAALYGDIKCLQIMQKAKPSSIHLLAKDLIGKTALELAKWRRDNNTVWSRWCNYDADPDPATWYEIFKALYLSIFALQNGATEGEVEQEWGENWDEWIEDDQEQDTPDENGEDDSEGEITEYIPGAFPDV